MKGFKRKDVLCRALRVSATDAEKVLWEVLRNRQVADAKFRRQHYISGYVLDFYCPKIKLCIELDGSVHDRSFAKESDKKRTEFLKTKDINVMRFRNKDVKLLGRCS